MATATSMLNAARAEIGYRETPNNRTKFGRAYGWDGVPWCDIFISVLAANIGARSIIGRFAYTPSHAAWFKARGQWFTWKQTPRRGDIVFFAFNGAHRMSDIQHVGIVESYDAARNVVVTIEGNTSAGVAGSQADGGGVYRRRRNTLYVVGYGRPAYSGERNVRTIPRPSRSAPRRVPLLVDGVWGRSTTRRLQEITKATPVDGVFGPGSKKALQRWLKVPATGALNRTTIRALQGRVGVTRDGQLGPKTVAALQRYLNRH